MSSKRIFTYQVYVQLGEELEKWTAYCLNVGIYKRKVRSCDLELQLIFSKLMLSFHVDSQVTEVYI